LLLKIVAYRRKEAESGTSRQEMINRYTTPRKESEKGREPSFAITAPCANPLLEDKGQAGKSPDDRKPAAK
jgi:hypothetical protein